MNIVIKEEIGRGKDGIVYLTEDKLILKISSDPTEASIALVVSSLQHRNLLGNSFPSIKGAWAEDNKYYVLRENVEDGNYTPLQLEAINFLSHGWVCDDNNSIKEALTREPKLELLLNDLKIVFNCSGIKIKDIGSHNNVAQNFILRDLSRASGIDFKLKKWKKNNKYKIISKAKSLELIRLEEERVNTHYARIINHIVTDISDAFTYANLEDLKTIFNTPKYLERIKPIVADFIKNYNSTENLTYSEQRLFPILLKNREFSNLLEDNLFYKLKEIKKRELTINQFDIMFDKVSEKYYNNEMSLEIAEIYLNKLKEKLSLSDLMEYRIPKKEIFNYCEKKKLQKKLENDLRYIPATKKHKI